MLRLFETTNQSMAQFSQGAPGDIAVGLMPTMTRVALAPAMRRFIDAFPNVTVRVVEAFSPILTQSVLNGELDFAIVPSIPGRAGLKTQHFLTTHETLVSRNDPAAHLKPVRMADLAPMRLVLPSIANTRRTLIETYLASNGVQVERLLEMDSMMGTLDFVASSEWRTVVPAIMLEADDAHSPVCMQPIVEPVQPLDLVLIEPSRHVIAPPARAFLDLLHEEAEGLNRRWAGHFGRHGRAAPPAEGGRAARGGAARRPSARRR